MAQFNDLHLFWSPVQNINNLFNRSSARNCAEQMNLTHPYKFCPAREFNAPLIEDFSPLFAHQRLAILCGLQIP